MTPEGKIKAKINRVLDKATGVYRFMPVQNGMGAPGLDYFVCWDGKFLAIEAKVEGKGLTPRQRITAEKIMSAGGMFMMINDQTSVDILAGLMGVENDSKSVTRTSSSRRRTRSVVRKSFSRR